MSFNVLFMDVRADEDNRKRFEIERLSAEDVEMEDLNFYYADYSRYVAFHSIHLSQITNAETFANLFQVYTTT